MEYKYITSISKTLLKDFLDRRVIPFIGSGFSKNADISNGCLYLHCSDDKSAFEMPS